MTPKRKEALNYQEMGLFFALIMALGGAFGALGVVGAIALYALLAMYYSVPRGQ